MKILTIQNKEEAKFLRHKTADFDFSKFNKKEIKELIKTMKKVVVEANGIGLAANQIGLNLKVFVVKISKIDRRGHPRNLSADQQKFYAIFNPEIIKYSQEKELMTEGCLSVPGVYGGVERSLKVTLKGFDKNGKPLKIKAWGILAHVFQHETDHLKGMLFIDRAKNIHKIESKK